MREVGYRFHLVAGVLRKTGDIPGASDVKTGVSICPGDAGRTSRRGSMIWTTIRGVGWLVSDSLTHMISRRQGKNSRKKRTPCRIVGYHRLEELHQRRNGITMLCKETRILFRTGPGEFSDINAYSIYEVKLWGNARQISVSDANKIVTTQNTHKEGHIDVGVYSLPRFDHTCDINQSLAPLQHHPPRAFRTKLCNGLTSFV